MKKNKFFLAGLPALVLAWGMMVAGCDNGTTSGGTNDEEKSITITGLAEAVDGRNFSITMFNKNNDSIYGNAKIDEGSATVDLVIYDEDTMNNVPWKGNGPVKLWFRLMSDDTGYYYTGGKEFTQLGLRAGFTYEQLMAKLPSYVIAAAESKIDYNQFRPYNPDWPK